MSVNDTWCHDLCHSELATAAHLFFWDARRLACHKTLTEHPDGQPGKAIACVDAMLTSDTRTSGTTFYGSIGKQQTGNTCMPEFKVSGCCFRLAGHDPDDMEFELIPASASSQGPQVSGTKPAAIR